MIRGKGSIRKDKEPEVRGKPGWEHVFNEPLHVVIELADPLDDSAATAALNRAKDQVERLLVPVPEERDGLKRQQLRALAIMNGTFRGGPTTSHEHLSIPPYASSPPTQNLSTFSVEPQSAHMYLGDTTSVPLHSPIVPRYDHPSEDNSFFRMVHYPSQPSFSFDQNRNNLSGRASPSSGATSPNTYDNSVNPLSVLTSKIQQCAIDEFGSSSVGDDSPDSSHTSDDGEPSTHIAPASYPDIQVKSSSISPSNRADTSLGVGGFIGQEFYNGAFSNGGASPNTWDQHPSSSTNETSTPFSSALYGLSPVPSPQVLTNSTSTVTPIDRHYGY